MKHGFTLIEIIIVITIVAVLAAVGLSQYSLTVEKSRLAEAKVRIGTIRQLAQEYYMNNGTITGITNADVGADYACTSSNFYRYTMGVYSTFVNLAAYRCITGSGGKTPNATREYVFYQQFHPDTGQSSWNCYYTSDGSSCFGLPTN